MYDYIKIEIERLKLEIEGLEADVRGKSDLIEKEMALIPNKEVEQDLSKPQSYYEKKCETEARISLMQQRIHFLENVIFLILIASEKDYIVSHCYPMESRIESDAKNDVTVELEKLPSNSGLILHDGDYLAIVVRKATYDRTKIICREILKDRNTYITSKAFSVNGRIISVK